MSSTFASPSASSADNDAGSKALAACGWTALALLVAAVLTFGVDRHLALGLFTGEKPLDDVALHQKLNEVAAQLGLSRQSDTRGGDLQQDPAKLAAARRELAAIVQRNPRSLRAIYYQAVERMAAHDFAGARAAAGRGLLVKPDDLQFLILQGAASASEKNYAEAEKSFRRVIEVEPRALPAYDNLAQTLWLMGRQDEAKAVYRQRLQLEGLPLAPGAPAAPKAAPSATPQAADGH